MKLSVKELAEVRKRLDGEENLTAEERKRAGMDRFNRKSKTGKPKKQKGLSAFEQLCKAHGLPAPELEYQFAAPRRWRFDYLFGGWLALEVDGGAWTQGRHTRGQGFINDIEKLNEAVILGYAVVRCTPQEIESGAACDLVRRALLSEGEQP